MGYVAVRCERVLRNLNSNQVQKYYEGRVTRSSDIGTESDGLGTIVIEIQNFGDEKKKNFSLPFPAVVSIGDVVRVHYTPQNGVTGLELKDRMGILLRDYTVSHHYIYEDE